MHTYMRIYTYMNTHLQAEQAALAGMKAKETRDVPDKVDKAKKNVVHKSRKMTGAQAEKDFDSYWDKLRKSCVCACACVCVCVCVCMHSHILIRIYLGRSQVRKQFCFGSICI